MHDLQTLLARHAEWHKRRQGLSWEEKLRLAEAVLPTVRALRAQRAQLAAPLPPESDPRPPQSRPRAARRAPRTVLPG